MGDIIGYGGKEWREYKDYSAKRAQLFDYYGTPEAEEIEGLLEAYQVSKLHYDAFRHYNMLEASVPTQFLQEVVEHQKEYSARDIDFGDGVKMGWQVLFDEGYEKYNKVLIAVYILLILALLASRRWSVLIPATMIVGARTAVWGFLCWRGRLPLRVSLPLLLCESLLLLVLVLEAYGSMKRRDWLKLLVGAGAILLLVQALKTFRQQFPEIREEHKEQQILMEGLRELQDYCNQEPENRYLMEAEGMMYYRGSALETELYQQPNYLVSGNWYSYSPVMKEKIDSYIKEAEYQELYAITYKWEEDRNASIIPYLNELYGGIFQVVDEITVSYGGNVSCLSV